MSRRPTFCVTTLRCMSEPSPEFRLLFDALAGRYLVLRVDPHWTVVAASASYRATFLAPDAKVIDMPLADVLAERSPYRGHLDTIRRALDDARRTALNVTLAPSDWMAGATPDAPGRYWRARQVPVCDHLGQVAWVIHVMEDADEDVRQAEQLETQRRRERLIIENLQDYAIFMVDGRGRVATWNQGAERLLGYREEEVLGESSAIFFTEEDRQNGVPEKEIETALHAGRALDDRWHLRKDGSRFFVTGLMTLLRDPAGRSMGLVKIMRDVTDRQLAQVERELLLESERLARAEAERTSHMKDEFLATLSHELRTPLNAILGWTQVLQSGPTDPEDIAQGLEVIERNTRVQAQLIDDLLDMSRIVSGKMRVDIERLSITAPVEAAIESVRSTASTRQIAVEVSFRHPGLIVMGDRNRLQQVMWNLLTNAIKFTPTNGSVEVTVEREGNQAVVTIRDTGQGIPPEFLPHVFDRFRQADSLAPHQKTGLGLGLAIVKQLVELHGGDVRAYSAGLGTGATFTVRLPLAEPPADEATRSGSSNRRAPAADSPLSLESIRVLAVDDEPDQLRVIQRLLEGVGAIVVTAKSADEAIEQLSRFKPDVLVSDISMPGRDGYDLMKEVRERPDTATLPAAALTALARPADRTRALRAGFQTHVCKPIEAPELVAVVASLAALRPR